VEIQHHDPAMDVDVYTPGGHDDVMGAGMDSSGNIWVYGGIGLDINGVRGQMNDLWKYKP
jgi:hypothetical protein